MAISVDNYLNCCRICLCLEKSDFFLDIDQLQLPDTDVSIRTALQKTTGIECPPDKYLPPKICQCCQLRLQDAYNFITEFCDNTLLLESLKQKVIHNGQVSTPSVGLLNEKKSEQTKPFAKEDILAPDEFTPSDHEILSIERLETTPSRTENENCVIFDMSEGDSKNSEDQDRNDFEMNLESDDETVDDDATDAVDFILRNLQPSHRTKKKYEHSVLTRYQCEVCEKSFQRKSNLVDHLRLHANVKLFACSYCSAAFVQAGNLKSHLRKHTLEKPYRCQFCEKSYTQSSALKTHVRYVLTWLNCEKFLHQWILLLCRTHTNTRDYICDICNKGFTNSSDLNKHKITHSDLRFYQCVKCEKRFFTQKVHLKKHIRAHHSNENFEQLLQQGTLKEGVCVNSDTKQK